MPAYVALESTVFAHGLPAPHNLETAFCLEEIVRAEGAIPKTVGLIAGRVVPGLSAAQIRHLATDEHVRKVSLRDLPVVIARRQDGATTVAASLWIAHQHRISVLATGGIGGVHRALEGPSFDVSADLEALARLPMIVVCSGAKAVLDLPATREVLETKGVTVVGYETDTMPAFYSRSSGLPVDVRCDTPEEVVAVARARHALGLPGATLVTVPVPEAAALDLEDITPAVDQALREAKARDLHFAAITPFLLERVSTLTGDRALQANIALLKNNARVAAAIACALSPPLVA